MKLTKNLIYENITSVWGNDFDMPISIRGVDGLSLDKPIVVALEWLMRTPHNYPFDLKKHKYRFKNDYTDYVISMFDLIYEASLSIERRIDISVAYYADALPIAIALIDGVKEWLLRNEENNWVKNFFFKMEYNEFRIQSSEDQLQIKIAINNLSLYLNKKLKGMGGTQIIHDFRKTSLNNYKHFMNVAFQAFEIDSSILLMRLDWGEKSRVPDDRAKFKSIEDYKDRFDKVSSYRKKMLRELRKMFKDDLSFFLWKIECAPVRGLHIHWLIGVNGSKYKDRVNVPNAIAKKWDDVIAEPSSYTRNQSIRQSHEDGILRVIEYSDPLVWRILGGYAHYLTKVDYLTRFRAPGNQRCCGSSKIKVIIGSKKGPKRSKKMPKLDILAVRRPLKELSVEMGWQEYKG